MFGDTCDLKDNMVPTYKDVIKFYEWNPCQIKLNRDTKNSSRIGK